MFRSTQRKPPRARVRGETRRELAFARDAVRARVDVCVPAQVDGAEFAGRFFRLSAELRRARLGEERRARDERRRRREEVEQELKERFYQPVGREPSERYTLDDEANALGKLAKVARGALTGAAAPELRPFKEGAHLDPPLLDHYLRVCFRVRLTPGELAALVGVLDTSGDGLVDASEFLNCFYKIVRVEQRRRHEDERGAIVQRQQAEERLKQKQQELFERSTAVPVMWPSIEEVEEYATRSAVVRVSPEISSFLADIDGQWPETRKRRSKRRSSGRR